MARARAASGDKATARSGMRNWVGAGACLVTIALLPGAAVLLAASCPVLLLALLSDRDPARRVFRAVALFSLAGLIAPAHDLVQIGYDLQAGLRVTMAGAATRVWAAGGIGWGLSELAAMAGTMTTHLQAELREKRLRQKLAALREEWELADGGHS